MGRAGPRSSGSGCRPGCRRRSAPRSGRSGRRGPAFNSSVRALMGRRSHSVRGSPFGRRSLAESPPAVGTGSRKSERASDSRARSNEGQRRWSRPWASKARRGSGWSPSDSTRLDQVGGAQEVQAPVAVVVGQGAEGLGPQRHPGMEPPRGPSSNGRSCTTWSPGTRHRPRLIGAAVAGVAGGHLGGPPVGRKISRPRTCRRSRSPRPAARPRRGRPRSSSTAVGLGDGRSVSMVGSSSTGPPSGSGRRTLGCAGHGVVGRRW